ncbi:MAG: prefoldin subunit alpha [Candidatus Bathyarchaeota archaeon]|nr:prefoldin subunit alpha [Candidatus Bathyarchaeota archaeon]
MSNVTNDEEFLRGTMVELRVLEGSVNLIQSRLNIIDNAIDEISMANTSLEGIKNSSKGSEILVPTGASSFVRTTLSDVKKVIMGVGAGVSIEKTIGDSMTDLKNRQDELEKIKSSLQTQLGQALKDLDSKRNQVAEVMRKRESGA